MTENIIIKSSVQKRFDSFIAHGRVLFFSAPCGFGKTVLADALLRGRNVLRQSAADPDCAIPPSAQDWDILLIDDLQLMQEEAGQQALCELIRSSPERRFVLLSRGVPPGCLTAFQYTGLMTVLEADDLLFDADDVRRLFQLSGANVTDSEIDGILKESVGYPLGVAITARCMSPDKPWTPELVARVFHEVFLYFETAIYRRFDLPVRRFLLELAPFESFDLEMARMVSGDPRAGERLDWLLRYTTMLRYDDCQRFHFWSGFRAFLLWEMEREYTEEKRRALLSRGGLYYELKEDFSSALDCYTRGGDHAKVSELLVRNAELHPGMGHYAEMEKYYRSLPEAEILASPSLMQGMSIHLNVLTAIALYRKKDERWRERLTAALDAAAEYRFIRTVSVYGTAVLPLLEALDWDGDKKWYKQIMAAVRKQAAFYPHFLEPRLAPGEELTPTELQILHLLCADKSNAEIAQIMDVKLPTVKTHVSHILDKLNVKRRAEAKTAAKKLRLIPDDL